MVHVYCTYVVHVYVRTNHNGVMERTIWYTCTIGMAYHGTYTHVYVPVVHVYVPVFHNAIPPVTVDLPVHVHVYPQTGADLSSPGPTATST
jgi:hypothetical protein